MAKNHYNSREQT